MSLSQYLLFLKIKKKKDFIFVTVKFVNSSVTQFLKIYI